MTFCCSEPAMPSFLPSAGSANAKPLIPNINADTIVTITVTVFMLFSFPGGILIIINNNNTSFLYPFKDLPLLNSALITATTMGTDATECGEGTSVFTVDCDRRKWYAVTLSTPPLG